MAAPLPLTYHAACSLAIDLPVHSRRGLLAQHLADDGQLRGHWRRGQPLCRGRAILFSPYYCLATLAQRFCPHLLVQTYTRPLISQLFFFQRTNPTTLVRICLRKRR